MRQTRQKLTEEISSAKQQHLSLLHTKSYLSMRQGPERSEMVQVANGNVQKENCWFPELQDCTQDIV
jgi:hypothetical protein